MKQASLPGVTSPSANAITALLLIEIPKRWPEARVWRRNVMVGIGMDTVHKAIGLLGQGQIKTAIEVLRSRPIHAGIPGESDIEGIMPVRPHQSDPDHEPYGVFLAIEVKAGRDRIRTEQAAFGAMVQRAGGIYVIARSVEQAMADLEAKIR